VRRKKTFFVPYPRRLAACIAEWERLPGGDTAWAVGVIRDGLRLDLHSPLPSSPASVAEPSQRLSAASAALIDAEVADLLATGAVQPMAAHEVRLRQNVFLVPKKDGSKRPVLDCRPLNAVLRSRRFKMEGIRTLRALVRRGDYFTKVDLKSAYHHVPMAPEASRLLAFRWRAQDYAFRSLPFGVSIAPWAFSRLMKVVAGAMREQGIRVIVYLDDLLFLSRTRALAQRDIARAVELLQRLGFCLKAEKCTLVPTQVIEFLGFSVNSRALTLGLTRTRARGLREQVRDALSRPRRLWRARDLAALIGRLNATSAAVVPARMRLFHLNRDKDRFRRMAKSWGGRGCLSTGALRELRWWCGTLEKRPHCSLTRSRPAFTLTTDSSLFGWGATLEGSGQTEATRGFWPLQIALGGPGSLPRSIQQTHINVLEMRAGLNALRAWRARLAGKTVRWCCDNTATVFCVARWGSHSPALTKMLLRLWCFCEEARIRLQIVHLPGVRNSTADTLSRVVYDPWDWKLAPALFRRVTAALNFLPTVDAFATAQNTQLRRFWCLTPQPGATAVDALAQDWARERVWANPPFNQIAAVLHLLQTQRTTALLVVPEWKAQPWWPLLQAMLIKRPIALPRRKGTFLPGFGGNTLPWDTNKWRALACLVSGHPKAVMAAQRRPHGPRSASQGATAWIPRTLR